MPILYSMQLKEMKDTFCNFRILKKKKDELTKYLFLKFWKWKKIRHKMGNELMYLLLFLSVFICR